MLETFSTECIDLGRTTHFSWHYRRQLSKVPHDSDFIVFDGETRNDFIDSGKEESLC